MLNSLNCEKCMKFVFATFTKADVQVLYIPNNRGLNYFYEHTDIASDENIAKKTSKNHIIMHHQMCIPLSIQRCQRNPTEHQITRRLL